MINMDPFSTLPDSARVWVFAMEPAPADPDALIGALRGFLAGWTSHGRAVKGDVAVMHRRFLVAAGNIADGSISGCGVDAMMRAVGQAAAGAHVRLQSSLMLHYRNEDGTVVSAARGRFRSLVRSGAIRDATHVFDLSITTLGALRAGKLEQPFKSAWHATMFRPAVPAA